MKILFGKVLAVLLCVCLLAVSVPMVLFASAETTTTVYDFNGTDFDTTLKTNTLGSNVPLIADTSSVPAGFTGSVMGKANLSYVSVGVDFAYPIDPAKIVSVKVRMYVPSSANENGSALRLYATNESTALCNTGIGYAAWGGVFDQWSEIDITSAVTSANALDANGYIDRFVIGLREKSGETRVIYYDSLIIESEGDPFVYSLPTTDTYDFNGTDFSIASANPNIGSYASVLADTSSVPAGFTGSVAGGSKGSNLQVTVGVNFDQPIDTTKVTSVKVRMYVAGTADTSSNIRIYVGSSDGTYEASPIYTTGLGGVIGEWSEIDITQYVTADAALTTGGYLDHFSIVFRDRGSDTARMVYFDSLIITGADYFVPLPDPVVITPTGVYAADTVNNNDWRFHLTINGTLPGEKGSHFGQNQVPVSIYNANDELLASTENGTALGSYYHNGTYLMPFTYGSQNYTYSNQPVEGDYIIFGKGTYNSSKSLDRITIEEDIKLVYTGGKFVLYVPEEPADPVTDGVYDFNGTHFSTPTTTNTNVTSTSKFATAVADTSSVPAGFTGGVYSVSASQYGAVWVDFGRARLDLTKITSIRVRLYIDSNTQTPKFRIFGSGGSYYEDTSLTTDIYGQWYEYELLTALQASAITKNCDKTVSRFMISLRTDQTPTVYFDSLIIEGEDYYAEAPTPETMTIVPTDLHSAGYGSAKSDWRFWLTPHTTFPTGENYYGKNTVPVTIYDSNDQVIATSSDGGLNATYYIADGYLMPFAVAGTSKYTYKNDPKPGDYIVFGKGTYAGDCTDHKLVVPEDITLTFTGSGWTFGYVDVNAAAYDFNGTDFAVPSDTTTSNQLGSVSYLSTKVEDTSGVPAGFTDGVYNASNTHYAATWVDFAENLDLNKIISIKIKMYISSYTLANESVAGNLRIIGAGNTYATASASLYGFDQWFELELLDLLKNDSVTKNADGTVDLFAVAFRARGSDAPQIYFDSISIAYTGDSPFADEVVEEPVPDEEGGIEDGIFDFNGVDFETPATVNGFVTNTGSFATKLTDTGDLPEGFAGGVYGVSHGAYVATWVDLNGLIDLSKVTSIKMRMYVPSYTLESGKSTLLRTFGTSESYVETAFTSVGGAYDQWVEIELLDILNDSKVAKRADGKIKKFLFAIRTYGSATVYFDKLIIEGTDYYTEIDENNYITVNTLSVDETLSNKTTYWLAYLNTDLDSQPGTAWDTVYTDVPVTINNTEVTMKLKHAGGTQLFLADLTFKILSETTSYAKITVKAGEYISEDGMYGLTLANDFTFYVYNDDVWNAAPPAGFTVDVTFEKMDPASLVNGSNWNMYAIPTTGKTTIGTSWQTKWADVVYEIDGVAYTGQMQRANSGNGLYWQIPGTQLSPAADGVTVVIKAGTYACSSGDEPAIRVTEDFTFYVIKGVVTTEFDFNDPAFTATVFVNVDKDTYTITDAETVNIDGETFNMGDVYDVIGTHTLVYTMYEREYTRELILYRIGEVGDTEQVDVCDVVLLELYLNDQEELTRSALLGADMNGDGAVTEADLLLLRKSLLLIDDVLILSPAEGETVMKPSAAVVEMTTDYDPNVSRGDALRTGGDLYYRDPLLVRWASNRDVDSYTLTVASKSDFSDALVFTTDKTEYTLYNLIPNTTYYWTLTAGDKTSPVQTFVTADTVRTLTIDGVKNSRDIGGYAALGGTIKYGKIYRTATLDNITEEGKFQMLYVLGVKTDFDVRTPGEGTAGSGSPLGDVNYLNFDAPYYWGNLVADKYHDAFAGEIRAIADASNYPLVVHCSVGRDRTGTLLFIIEGLCGMSKADLFMEYELSALSSIGGGGTDPALYTGNLMVQVNRMYDNIQAFAPDGTFAEACEAFLKQQFGITQAEIDAIRANLIDTGVEEEPEIPSVYPEIGQDPDIGETEIIQ
ncbi:MAG: tyrosine-protein phosphatase [Clostridia bacterium]|nr:tyrosine-protein phosphatase [Clostridia bacterium]